MLEKGSIKEEEDIKERERAKRRGKKIQSDEEETSSAQESFMKTSKEQARHVLLSDYEEADCFVVMDSQKKEENGDKVRTGTPKEKKGISKGELGVVLKKKRGRKRKIHRKRIGIDELEVHAIEDSEDSEGYDVLSAPEMAATAIEYLEEANEIRIRCKNIKRDLSGVMKRRLHNAKEIIKGLARTITKKIPSPKDGGEEEENETCFLRTENKELDSVERKGTTLPTKRERNSSAPQ